MHIINTSFGEYKAPPWCADVPTRTFTNDEGEKYRDVDPNTPEGAAFWEWMRTAEARSMQEYAAGLGPNPDLFINDARPF